MNARASALLLIVSAIGLSAGCSWMPFGKSQPGEATQSSQGQSSDAPTDAAPASSDVRGTWPTAPVRPVTGNEVDTSQRKASCTTAQRLRRDC